MVPKNLHWHPVQEYGENIIVLLKVGAFYEMYGLKDKNNQIVGSDVEIVCNICDLQLSERSNMFHNKMPVLIAGFRDYCLDKYVEKIVDVEGFDGLNLEAGFCKSHEGNRNELNKSCGELTKNSCVSTDCCVYAKMSGEEKCFSGDEHGPTFRRNSDGKTYDVDYYFFKDKCFGNGCEDN